MPRWSDFWGLISASRVIIYADFIDPFCYIGFHNLMATAEALGKPIEWRGFELNPDTPADGYRLETAANSDLRPGMWASVRDYAAKAGLTFPEPDQVFNTRRAHGLIHSLADPCVKNPLIGRIYQAYFIEKRDVSDATVLIDLANQFGVSAERVRGAIAAPRLAQKLERYREEAKMRAFPGMPGFVYRGKNYFGALSQESWRPILNSKSLKKESACTTK